MGVQFCVPGDLTVQPLNWGYVFLAVQRWNLDPQGDNRRDLQSNGAFASSVPL